jgi:biopolymer transport protein ExbB/TolQ
MAGNLKVEAMLEAFIWIILFALGYVGLSAVLERLLFHISRRPADETSLRNVLRRWRMEKCLSNANSVGLGWLRRCDAGDSAKLLELCLRERLQMMRFTSLLPMIADVATATGLLATVVALYQTASAAEHTTVIALGMQATVAGLVIAIPIKVFLGFFADRTNRLLSQADVVIETLESLQHPAQTSIVPAAVETIETLGTIEPMMPLLVVAPVTAQLAAQMVAPPVIVAAPNGPATFAESSRR